MDKIDLMDYIRSHTCKGFRPIPWFNREGKEIEWFWKDDNCYVENVMSEGKWIGSVYRNTETKEIVGVSIHLEAIAGFESIRKRISAEIDG